MFARLASIFLFNFYVILIILENKKMCLLKMMIILCIRFSFRLNCVVLRGVTLEN